MRLNRLNLDPMPAPEGDGLIHLPADEVAALRATEQQLLAISPTYAAEVASRALHEAPFISDDGRAVASEIVAARVAKGQAPHEAVRDFLASPIAATLLKAQGTPVAAPPAAPPILDPRTALAGASATPGPFQGLPGVGLHSRTARPAPATLPPGAVAPPPAGPDDPFGGALGSAEQRAAGQFPAFGLTPKPRS